MNDEKKKGYELYRERFLDLYKRGTNLPKEATLVQVINALVEVEQYNEATEMLFGGERGLFVNDRTGFMVFMSLWAGDQPELIRELARNHNWASKRPSRGFAILVYPGEFFVIPEPTVTKLRRLHLL